MIKIHMTNRIIYNLESEDFNNGITFDQMIRYFKGAFSTKERFLKNFCMEGAKDTKDDLTKFDLLEPFMEKTLAVYDDVEPYTYTEAFALENDEFRALVFETIDVAEMMKHLGNKKIATDGIEVKRKQFDVDGNFIGYDSKHNIYEVYEVSGDKLGLKDQTMYAVKCWCTTTNNEHWIWIDQKYKNDPLSAIASTFWVHENVIPHIKELKRQGDIMIIELTDEGLNVKPEGKEIPLTKEQYFELLTTET